MFRMEKPWEVNFHDEEGKDQGGLSNELITSIIREIQSDTFPLFIKSANQKLKVGENQSFFLPNSSFKDREKLLQFKFIGRIMGTVIRNRSTILLSFPPFFWKKIVCYLIYF